MITVSFRHHVLLLVALLLVWCAPLRAQYRRLETATLRMIYPDITLSYLAPYTARCFENSMRFHRALFAYQPDEKVNVILDDISDFGNAGVWAAPRNGMVVHVAPVNFVYETGPSNERMNFTMNHELVHVLALDQAAQRDRFFRRLFCGKVKPVAEQPETALYGYLTLPRRSAPRWYHEGVAVFLETWMAGGYGRAKGAYDEMVFRAKVLDGSTFYDPLGLESEGTQVDFMVGVNSYLYGTRFVSYMAYRESPEKIIQWISHNKGSKAYFASQFQHVFGMPLEDAWRDWVSFEREFQQVNIDSIQRYPLTQYRDLSSRALGSVSRAFLDQDSGELYVALHHPGQIGSIAAITVDTGQTRIIREVKGPALFFVTSLAFDPNRHMLYYTTDNNEWRDLVELDPRTGKARVLQENARIGDLAFNRSDASLWGVRHFNGISTLVRIAPPYTEWEQIFSWPFGRDLYDIDVSADGKWLSGSLAEISGQNTLRLFEVEALLQGDTTSVTLADWSPAIPMNFVFSKDGRYLYGSTYHTGAANVFRWNFETSAMEAVSNCVTGFFRPVPVSEDSLIVFRYTGEGFVPAWIQPVPLDDISPIEFLGQRIADRHPVVDTWMAGSPATVALESLITSTGDYAGISGIRLDSAYPVAQGYKEHGAVGYRFNFSDPIGIHNMHLTASVTPLERLAANERTHLEWGYERYNLKLHAAWNAADFYDLFGPTRTSRKGYWGGFDWSRKLVYDAPREMDLSVGSTGYAGLERLPEAQNITTSFDQLLSSSVRLRYKNLRASIGAIDAEKGQKWSAVARNNLVKRRVFPLFHGTWDIGMPVLFANSSVWLRTAAGWSPGERDEPFANFYFGGFGNNWVDAGEIKRYREFYAFPGVELNQIAGTNFARLLLDWNLPAWRFARIGKPALHAAWARLSVFGTGLVTNMGEASLRNVAANTGAQVDVRLRFLSQLNLTLSGGYAVAFLERARPSDEVMVSLKVY